ncbi:MAG: Crp/Fnr family transcriptional regulator [Bacteroidia bacterium]|nr:Crp/Fnr family transcriptional regulator [Bacteroidia bacterium]
MRKISENKTSSFYKKGDTIFYNGNRCTGLYAVYSGKVKLFKLGEQGKEQIVRFAKEGDLLGYRAMLAGENYHATAQVIEDSVICCVSKQHFLDVLRNNSDLSLNTIKMLADNLKRSENALVNIKQKNAQERVAESLFILKEKFGLRSDNSTLDVELSRREIGELAGLTTETTIRTLAQLSDQGMIELIGKQISIKDKKALLQLADLFD